MAVTPMVTVIDMVDILTSSHAAVIQVSPDIPLKKWQLC